VGRMSPEYIERYKPDDPDKFDPNNIPKINSFKVGDRVRIKYPCGNYKTRCNRCFLYRWGVISTIDGAVCIVDFGGKNNKCPKYYWQIELIERRGNMKRCECCIWYKEIKNEFDGVTVTASGCSSPEKIDPEFDEDVYLLYGEQTLSEAESTAYTCPFFDERE